MSSFKDLLVYKKALSSAMRIFELSKRFPKEETYSLTDQIRRSSRSVCANMAEAFSKRRYPAHFLSKITDCDAENAETAVWLDFASECKYVTCPEYNEMISERKEIGSLLGDILKNPAKYC